MLLTCKVVPSLADANDDVRAGAAAALLPAVPAVLAHPDGVVVTALVAALTDALAILDDLTASTAAIVALLGTRGVWASWRFTVPVCQGALTVPFPSTVPSPPPLPLARLLEVAASAQPPVRFMTASRYHTL